MFAHISLHVPGIHNVMNALAATAAAVTLGIPEHAVCEGLSRFTGAGRRFEYVGSLNGADIFDDYAHHPSEIKALLDMVEKLNYRRVILAFQSHTYSRTKALFNEFIKQLSRPDKVILTEIYAAREKDTLGVSSKDLSGEIAGSVYCRTIDELKDAIKAMAAPGDIILTVGAGAIFKAGRDIAEK
jgi:UDP-N-acetylmuramate--alanine ligase